MKVLMLNGSPRVNGNTSVALEEMRKVFQAEGVETEIVQVGPQAVRGCIACSRCVELGKCVFDDIVNELAPKFEAADGLVVASPVYYASANATLIAVLDRLFYSTHFDKAMKVGASVVCARRGGCSATFDELNKYFTITNMPIASSQYWNSIHGRAPGEADQRVREDLERMLTEQAGRKVELLVPKRGNKVNLVRLANKNAREELERSITKEERKNQLLSLFGSMLGLENPPRRIEAYDISNTGSDDIVGGMTVFVDGKPLKSAYRKFHLKDMQGPDDYASMDQVLTRRFRRYLEDNEKFNVLPDVILMDGGLGQVGVACRVLAQAGLDVPVFGMVKDGRHRTRALVAPDGREIGLQAQPAIFALVGRIQEETHRYAISFHHASHSKRTVASALEEIAGVGEVRRNQLLKHFKSVKAIREADYEALCKAVPKSVAQAVYTHFHGTTGETEGGSKE